MRRNRLLIHSISENKDESTDNLVIESLKSDMNIGMKIKQIDPTHRIRVFKSDGGNRKSRPITVKLEQYADRCNVFVNKKVLKVKNILITESLTEERIRKLKEAKEQHGFKRVWTMDRKIYLKKIALLISL